MNYAEIRSEPSDLSDGSDLSSLCFLLSFHYLHHSFYHLYIFFYSNFFSKIHQNIFYYLILVYLFSCHHLFCLFLLCHIILFFSIILCIIIWFLSFLIYYHSSMWLGFDVICFSMLLFLVIYFMQDRRMYLGNYVNVKIMRICTTLHFIYRIIPWPRPRRKMN